MMLLSYLAKESSFGTLKYTINEPLAPHSTFGIGGQCDYFVEPFSIVALTALISFLKKQKIRYLIIGNGSNCLFDDTGYRGCIVSTKQIRDLSFHDNEISVSCGYSLIALSSIAQKNGLSGLEFACSIPATVGGAVYMNAGAYGGEMKDVVSTVSYLSPDGTVIETDDHRFDYRHSIYQSEERVILSCKLLLTPYSPEDIHRKMLENKSKREATQPIKEKSAGSIFRREPDCIPAKLIDEAGLKGTAIGDAEISQKHAGFIVNRGNATSQNVLDLISYIQTTVYKRYGIHLHSEIRYIPST